MISAVLITLWVGINYVIPESAADYDAMTASHSVYVWRNDLRVVRFELRGFREGLLAKTDNDTRDMLFRMDQGVIGPLQVLWNTVNEEIAQGRDVEHCYIEAHASAKEVAKKHMALVAPCIDTFTKATEATLMVIPDRLEEIHKIEDDMITILPDCEKEVDKATCIQKRLNIVKPPILNLENVARNIIENGYNDYLAQHDAAEKCLIERYENLGKEMVLITSEANRCVRQS